MPVNKDLIPQNTDEFDINNVTTGDKEVRPLGFYHNFFDMTFHKGFKRVPLPEAFVSYWLKGYEANARNDLRGPRPLGDKNF